LVRWANRDLDRVSDAARVWRTFHTSAPSELVVQDERTVMCASLSGDDAAMANDSGSLEACVFPPRSSTRHCVWSITTPVMVSSPARIASSAL
jgi:hypothetical protein